jgi:hypothetical protein
VVIITDARSCFFARACARGLGDGALALHPGRFNTIEPPPYVAAGMPGGVLPDHDEHLLAVVGQPFGPPHELWRGHVADRTPIHEAQEHGMGLRTPQVIAGERCGSGILFGRGVLHHTERRPVSPGGQGGVGPTAPPYLIGKPDPPRGVPVDQS